MIGRNDNYKYSDITETIIKEAYYVYNILGYGFLEKVYENALFKRLNNTELHITQQYPINVYFENEKIGEFFCDLIVDNKVIVEVKAVERLNAAHEVQLVNYLKATKIEVGLLINFGKRIEIRRKVFSKNKNRRK